MTVSDGQFTASTNFQLTVNAVNDPPTISPIAGQATSIGTAVGPINFTIGDPETAAASLTVTGSSSNTALVPNANIVFGGTGANRLVTVTPVANQTGSATITVTVSDSQLSSSALFTLTVSATPAGLMAAYGFNEVSGQTTLDGSGNFNLGTLSNGPVWVAGRYGNGILFDGVNDFVSVADNVTLDLTNTGTIEAWVKPNAVNRWHGVIAKGSTNSEGAHNYSLEIGSNNAVLCSLGNGATAQLLTSSIAMTAGVFRHLACTWNGTTVALYIDGVLNASSAQVVTPTGNPAPLLIGQFGGNVDRFNGTIDEVRIYNRGLSGTEIQTDMSRPISGGAPDTVPPTDPTNLVATPISSTQIDLSWTASMDNVAVIGYQLERCEGAGCSNFTQVAAPTGIAFNDRSLSAATNYSYRVRAADAVPNVGGYSNTASATTEVAPPASQGFVAAYGFSEGSGNTTMDGSGNANVGTLTNGPVWTAGRYGNGILFDGVSDFVSVADSGTLDLTNDGTIEAWVKLNAVNRWHSVIAKGNANSWEAHNYALEIGDTNALMCSVSNGVASQVISSSVAITAGIFRHVACTWNGTTIALYIDGVLNASSAEVVIPVGNTAPLFIGQFGGNVDRFLGAIDEVRIYNRALSQAEIQVDLSAPVQ